MVFYENSSSFFDVFYGATSDNGLDETQRSANERDWSGYYFLMWCGDAYQRIEGHLHLHWRWWVADANANGNRYTG